MQTFPPRLPVPLLLKPIVLTLRNRIKRRHNDPKEWFRNGLLLLLTLGVMFSIYFGGIWVLKQLETQIDFVFFHPSLFLGLILVFLLLMLLMTNTASALGCLFFGRDLDIILSSPVSGSQLFFGKLAETIVTSSWMTVVFLTPAICLFGSYYSATLSFYALAAVILIPYFVIPAALSMIIATALAVLIPINFRRELILIATALVFFGFYSLIRLGLQIMGGDGPVDAAGLIRVVSFFTIADVSWSPSNWAAVALGELLVPSGRWVLGYVCLSYLLAGTILSLSYLIIRCFHWLAYTHTGLSMRQSPKQRKRPFFPTNPFSFLGPQTAGLIKKEFISVMRDMTQSVQALLLFALSALYLYLLNFQHLFQQVIPAEQQQWWKVFLIVVNICLESFIITAMGTRLVFPSLSREGSSFWILQSAPLSFRRMLWTKFAAWFCVVVFCTSIVFGAAAALVFGSVSAVLAKLALNFCIALGLVGLGIGFGAYFINLTWDHPSQLIAGFGSLVYMLTCVFLITLTTFAALAVIYFNSALGDFQTWRGIAFRGLALLIAAGIFIINAAAAWWALRLGERRLQVFE